jgi:PKD repeat protein
MKNKSFSAIVSFTMTLCFILSAFLPINRIAFAEDLTGTVSGYVFDDQGNPLENIAVNVEGDPFGGIGGCSGPGGYFEISGVPLDTDFRVRAAPPHSPNWCGGPEDYVTEMYPETRYWDNAEVFHLSESDPSAANVDFTLTYATGSISGYVFNEFDQPIEGADVCPEVFDNENEGYWCEITDEYGYFQNRNLPDGDYLIRVNVPSYGQLYNPGTFHRDESEPITVSDGMQTSGILVHLPTIEPEVYFDINRPTIVESYGWIPDKEISLWIDGETFGGNPSNSDGGVVFDLGETAIFPGQTITLSDGSTTSHLIVSSIDFSLDFENEQIDISSNNDFWARISCRNVLGQSAVRRGWIVEGTFEADFSQSVGEGEEDGVCDVERFETWIDISVSDESGEDHRGSTQAHYYHTHPIVWTTLGTDHFSIFNWPLGEDIHVEVKSPEDEILINDYFTPQPHPEWYWDSETQIPLTDYSPDLRIEPYQTITLNDEISIFVMPISVDENSIDMEDNIISGTTEPMSELTIDCALNGEWFGNRYLRSDENGVWTVNFGTEPSPEFGWGICEFQPNIIFEIHSYNPNDPYSYSDTVTFYRIPAVSRPSLEAQIFNRQIFISGFPEGESVTLNIYSEADEVLFTDSIPSPVESYWTENFTLLPGQTLEFITDTSTTYLDILDIKVTSADPTTGIVTGTTAPNRPVRVESNSDTCYTFRETTSDNSGNWSINFLDPEAGEVCELTNGTRITPMVNDREGENHNGLTSGIPYYIRPTNPGSISGTISPAFGVVESGNQVCVENYYSGPLFGELCTYSDEIGDYTIDNLPPGDYVLRVWHLNHHYLWAPGTGDRSEADIIHVEDANVDYDISFLNFPHLQYPAWQNPWIVYIVNSHYLVAEKYPENETVHAWVYNSLGELKYDLGSSTTRYSNAVGYQTAEWDVYGLSIIPGDQFVVVSPSLGERSLEVTNFSLDGIDYNEDTLTGAAVPHTEVVIFNQPEWWISRTITINAEGTWFADFSDPLAHWGTKDITPNTFGSIGTYDEDLDIQVLAFHPETIQGQVLLDGEPLPGVEVFSYTPGGKPHYRCTDENGGFKFFLSNVEKWSDYIGATGKSVALACPNADFLDPVGIPLMTQYYDGHNGIRIFDPVHTGFEIPVSTMNFNVIRSWAQIPVASTTHVIDMYGLGLCPNGESACDISTESLELKSYDLTNPDFINAWGTTPDSSLWAEIYNTDIGADSWDSIGLIGENQSTTIRLPNVHDTLLIGRFSKRDTGQVLFSASFIDQDTFIDRGDGVKMSQEISMDLVIFSNSDEEIEIYFKNASAGMITGNVIDEYIDPQPNIQVCLEEFFTGGFISCEYTNSSGDYAFPYVPNGKYIFWVSDYKYTGHAGHPGQYPPGTQDRLIAGHVDVESNNVKFDFSLSGFIHYGEASLPMIAYYPNQNKIWVMLPSFEADAHVIIHHNGHTLYDLGVRQNLPNEDGDYLAIFETKNLNIPFGATIDVMNDGESISSLVISSDFYMDSINNEQDTVSGKALPYSILGVNTQDPWGNRRPLTDENGNWEADFSRVIEGSRIGGNGVIVDLTPDTLGNVIQLDSDGDAIIYLLNDADGDEIADSNDNSPEEPNPDQLDSDSDAIPDVNDLCPDEAANTCDQTASIAKSITYYGDTLETPDRSIKLEIPAGALLAATSLGITTLDSADTLQIGPDLIGVVSSFSITPHGTTFAVPVTLSLKWSGVAEEDEPDLKIFKDGILIAGPCDFDSRCDMVANTFTVPLDSLSYFILGYPANEPPTASCITAPLEPVIVNTTVNTTFIFSDPDENDSHSVTWDWGDGSTSMGVLSSSGLSASGQHTYTKAGVYSVTATVQDQAGESAFLTYNYIVVFDPSSGFVTGGGWAISPAGSVMANPTLTGKLNFGLDSKYHKFALFPSGNTKFEFKAANLNFESNSYLWMLVDGAQAQYRGSGTVNGTGDYAFIVTVVDGKLVGTTRVDLIRVKIWNKLTGEIILDTQPGAPDNAEPTLAIGGGSITIHK